MELKNREQCQNISLNDFPKSLRKLAEYMLNSDEILTVTEAIKKGDFNYDSITTMISREKKKGRDFKRFMNEQMQILLNGQKLRVTKALISGAVKRSHADRKLYFQLTGDLKESPNINVGTLAIGVNITGLNQGENERDKGTIDITPTIPDGKG